MAEGAKVVNVIAVMDTEAEIQQLARELMKGRNLDWRSAFFEAQWFITESRRRLDLASQGEVPDTPEYDPKEEDELRNTLVSGGEPDDEGDEP